MNHKEEASPTLDFRAGKDEPKPADFNPSDWTVIKRQGDTVAATHRTGVTRKLPAEWLE